MKYLFTLSIGFVGAEHEEEFDYPEVDDMEPKERDKYLEQDWQDWANNYIDGGWHKIDESQALLPSANSRL